MHLETHGQKGFTLVELMVSLGIFLVVSMGLLPLLINGIRITRSNALHNEARRLAGEAMAVLQGVDYGDLPGLAGQEESRGPYQLTSRVSGDQDSGAPTRLTVDVSWSAVGRHYSYRLQSIRVRP